MSDRDCEVIATKARIQKRVDRIGKITSDRSFFKTPSFAR